MDGMEKNDSVVVIAATNRIDQLDPALRRPGRFDYTVRVPLPTEAERNEILGIYLKNKPGTERIARDELAARTAGYTGADLENLVRIACVEAIEKEGSETLEQKHIEAALSRSRPSLTKEQVEYYEQMITGTGNPSTGKLPMFR
jgi:transitional endoplasmic reticulum ATPase